MKTRCKHQAKMLILLVGWAVVGWAQDTKPVPKPDAALKIEGEVTQVQITTAPGPPTLTVKTPEGKEYVVHVGPLRSLRQGFSPKVGDKIKVTGTFCCEMEGKAMIHSSEIALRGKTYKTPLSMGPPAQGTMGHGMGTGCCGQGMQGATMQSGCCGQGMHAEAPHGCPGCKQ